MCNAGILMDFCREDGAEWKDKAFVLLVGLLAVQTPSPVVMIS